MCRLRLQWSFVATASDRYRDANWHTVTFHYDVQDLDILYVIFYLTDTDRNSGAHELITGSHDAKSMKFLLSSARRDDVSLRAHYKNGRAFQIIEGKAGSGFIEDTSCFHRARIPVSAPRLALQLRYS